MRARDVLAEAEEARWGGPIHSQREIEDERVADLLAQHPDLADISVPEWENPTESAVYEWLDGIEAVYGTHREVTPLAPEDHTRIDPLTELGLMGVPPEKIILATQEDDR